MKRLVMMRSVFAAVLAVSAAACAMMPASAEPTAAPEITAVRPEKGPVVSSGAVDDGAGVKPAMYVPSGTTFGTAKELPRSYKTKTTGIREQGAYQTCWAFSGIGAMEAFLSRIGKGDHDLSEQHLSWWATKAYNDGGAGWQLDGLYEGGYSMISAGYFISWEGAKLEEEVPYIRSRNDAVPDNMDDAYTAYGATGIMYVNNDIDSVKNAIYNYGGVATSYNNGSGYGLGRRTYYQSGTPSSYNGHAITVIGWDDDFPREDFGEHNMPPEKGAWLIKNSWGEDSCEDGYMWVSYYDSLILNTDIWGANLAFTSVRTMNRFDRLYQNEKYGATYFTYLVGRNGKVLPEASFANVFDFDDDHRYLQEVIFETQSQGADYEVYFIPVENDMPIGDEANWVLLDSGEVKYSGYICADVSGKLQVSGKGAIGVKISTKEENDYAMFGVDEWMTNSSGYVFVPDAKRGDSFVISDGKVYDLLDVYAENNDNIGGTLVIKAVASAEVVADADDDGVVTSDDALFVLRKTVLVGDTPQEDIDKFDVNRDGVLNSEDALMILRKSAGMITEF